jgi:hypothetical protein
MLLQHASLGALVPTYKTFVWLGADMDRSLADMFAKIFDRNEVHVTHGAFTFGVSLVLLHMLRQLVDRNEHISTGDTLVRLLILVCYLDMLKQMTEMVIYFSAYATLRIDIIPLWPNVVLVIIAIFVVFGEMLCEMTTMFVGFTTKVACSWLVVMDAFHMPSETTGSGKRHTTFLAEHRF